MLTYSGKPLRPWRALGLTKCLILNYKVLAKYNAQNCTDEVFYRKLVAIVLIIWSVFFLVLACDISVIYILIEDVYKFKKMKIWLF